MSEACLKQIRYWCRSLQESEKGHRRKNKTINRLRKENSELKAKVAAFMMTTAIIEFEKSKSK